MLELIMNILDWYLIGFVLTFIGFIVARLTGKSKTEIEEIGFFALRWPFVLLSMAYVAIIDKMERKK